MKERKTIKIKLRNLDNGYYRILNLVNAVVLTRELTSINSEYRVGDVLLENDAKQINKLSGIEVTVLD
jgi:hypothetical protein